MNTCKHFLILCLAGLLLGCGGDKDKGVNKDADKPAPADKAQK